MDEKIEKVISQIIDTDIIVSKKENVDDIIDKIEHNYNVNLPLEYKEFLIEYGGSFIKENKMYQPIENSPVTPDDGFESMAVFFGVTKESSYNIEMAMQTYKESLGSDVIPIADADGGDLICLGLKDENRDKVYYWYHEEEKIDKHGKDYLYLVANSFKEFILTFTTHERKSNVNLDDIEIFLDEDLLKD